jgi:S-(hydroxymethyl)glutathione dehydrogenase/alcohol dehydrogenase
MKDLDKKYGPFKAAILVDQKKPLIIDDISLPNELNFGQLLVKIHFSGICGSQIGEISGKKGPDKYLPHLLGHEASATVLEVGCGIDDLSPGDNVILHWRQNNGIQSKNPIYKWKDIKLNAGSVTTFNEYAIVSHNRVTKITNDFDLKTAALYGCAITTGFGVIENNIDLKLGQSIVVFGSGGVGLNIIQAAKLMGASPIIAIDQFVNRSALSLKMGADYFIDSNDCNPFERINEILGSQKLDYFIDNTGNVEIIKNGYDILDSKGRLVLVGVPDHKKNISIHSLPMHFGKTIIGSHGGESIPQIDIPRYINFSKNRNINFNNIITNEYNLVDINYALDDMVKGNVSGRCIIGF